MKFIFLAFFFSPCLVNGQLIVSNKNCIWQDSAILYRWTSNELIPKDSTLLDSISSCFGEIVTYGSDLFYYRSSENSVQTDTLYFFLRNQEIGKQSFEIRNTGIDTLSWWSIGTISHSELKENRTFQVINESGYTIYASIIGFGCHYQLPGSGSDIQSFSICDSTLNYDTEIYEWIPGEYESFRGNQFPDCTLSFLNSLPTGTILYFDRFISICPSCIAQRRSWEFQLKLVN